MLPVHEAPTCSVAGAAEIVGSKWTVLIVHDLSEGPRRFTELERSCAGISPRTLAERLRWLESEEIVLRQSYPESPPRVEYALTPKGKALLPVVQGDAPLRPRVARLRRARHGHLTKLAPTASERIVVTVERGDDGRSATRTTVGALELYRLVFPPAFRHGVIDPPRGYVAVVLKGGVCKSFRQTRSTLELRQLRVHPGRSRTLECVRCRGLRDPRDSSRERRRLAAVRSPSPRASPHRCGGGDAPGQEDRSGARGDGPVLGARARRPCVRADRKRRSGRGTPRRAQEGMAAHRPRAARLVGSRLPVPPGAGGVSRAAAGTSRASVSS